MKLPNFLILGAPKAGTTSLYYYLQQHPQIYMSSVKEPNFFALNGEQPRFAGPRDDEASMTTESVYELEAYQQLFAQVTDEKRWGEASTMSLYLPNTPEKIQRYIPDAKLIAVLRHPIDRAFSHFLHLRRTNREWLTDFLEAVREEPSRIEKNWAPAWHYLQVGFYGTQLQRYFERFNRDQIRVYLYDDLKADPIAFTQNIFAFLEVDSTFVLDMSTKHNVAVKVQKNRYLYDFLVKDNPLKTVLRSIVPASFRQPMAAKVYRANMEPVPKMTAEIRRQLLPVFRDDILQLQDLIQQDLSSWMKA